MNNLDMPIKNLPLQESIVNSKGNSKQNQDQEGASQYITFKVSLRKV